MPRRPIGNGPLALSGIGDGMLRATLCVMLLSGGVADAGTARLNGFDLSQALVPAREIHRGGPPKDGIPAIDEPRFVAAGDARFLRSDDRILGMARDGTAKAYPIKILNWHEIVNDTLAGEPVVVTWCPLCGSGMAFDARIDGRHLTFGVSGLLYNSDVLLYDRQTASLWSQIAGQAISGPMKGERLQLLPLAHTTWGDWRARHPDTLVLSTETGYARSYDRDPYAGYIDRRDVWFPVRHESRRYHPKERVLGITIGDKHKAYPFAELSRTPGTITDDIDGTTVTVRFDAEHDTAAAYTAGGEQVPGVILFWFAWYAFHPDTEIFTAP